jgi:hypothetical protein
MALQGRFQDKNKTRSIIFKIVTNQYFCIWHAFFGFPGGNNDVNVLHRSPFVTELLKGEKVGFMVNGTVYLCYYLLEMESTPLGIILCKPYMNPKTKSGDICLDARRSMKRC